MRLDLYMREIACIARQQTAMLDEAHSRLLDGRSLSRLEHNGILHAYQVLIENAIGKAKHTLKANGDPVPVSAYDAFSSLAAHDSQIAGELTLWNAAIGLRNHLVHDYMNIEMEQVLTLVREEQCRFITRFLLDPIRIKAWEQGTED